MEWISVKDKFPDEEGRYIVYCKSDNGNGIYFAEFWICETGHRYWYVGKGQYTVTHWIPMPKLPKD